MGASVTEPHVPIYTSANLATAKRVIILFYELKDDLGVFAHRIVGGRGGVNAGSAINFVKHIQTLHTSSSNTLPPGVILANMGQLLWCRSLKKAVTQMSWLALPQKSAVEAPYNIDPIKNTVPLNRTRDEHCAYIFNHVVEQLCQKDAKLDIIGVSDGAMRVSAFFNNEQNWKKWGPRIEAFAALATFQLGCENTNKEFAQWLSNVSASFSLLITISTTNHPLHSAVVHTSSLPNQQTPSSLQQKAPARAPDTVVQLSLLENPGARKYYSPKDIKSFSIGSRKWLWTTIIEIRFWFALMMRMRVRKKTALVRAVLRCVVRWFASLGEDYHDIGLRDWVVTAMVGVENGFMGAF